MKLYNWVLYSAVNDDDDHKPFSAWGIEYFTKTRSAATAVVDPLKSFLEATQDNSDVYCVYEEGHECTLMEFQKALQKFCGAENIHIDIKREMKGLVKALGPTEFTLQEPSANTFWSECKHCGKDVAKEDGWDLDDACCAAYKGDPRPKRNGANPDGAKCIRHNVKADDRRAATKIKGMKLI